MERVRKLGNQERRGMEKVWVRWGAGFKEFKTNRGKVRREKQFRWTCESGRCGLI